MVGNLQKEHLRYLVFLLVLVLLMVCSTSCVSNKCWNTGSCVNDEFTVHITEHDVMVSRSSELLGEKGVILRIDDNVIADDVYSVFESLLPSGMAGNIWLALPGGDRIQILYGDIAYYYRNRRFDIQISCEIKLGQEKLGYRRYNEDKEWGLAGSADLEKIFEQHGSVKEIEIRSTTDFPFGRINKICQALVRHGCRKVFLGVVVK